MSVCKVSGTKCYVWSQNMSECVLCGRGMTLYTITHVGRGAEAISVVTTSENRSDERHSMPPVNRGTATTIPPLHRVCGCSRT